MPAGKGSPSGARARSTCPCGNGRSRVARTDRRWAMKVLYLATAGAGDPTRGSLPLHIAANGSVEAGQECALVLAGDATELVSRETAQGGEGVGVPPAPEPVPKLLDHQGPSYIWNGCPVARC